MGFATDVLVDLFRLSLFRLATLAQSVTSSHFEFGARGGSNIRLFANSIYLGFFGRWRLRKRTPGPPPFSSMNSIPAAAKIFSIF
jgi:hypothetical protein